MYENTTTNAGCEATKNSPIDEALACLRSEQGRTSSLVAAIEAKLASVLSPDAAESQSRDKALSRSPLHGSLNDRAAEQSSINDNLRSLLDRLTT